MDNNEKNSWYAPLNDGSCRSGEGGFETQCEEAFVYADEPAEKNKKHGFWIVLLILAAVSTLFVASFAVFGWFPFGKGESNIQVSYGSDGEEHSFSFGPDTDFDSAFGFNTDGDDEENEESDSEAGMPDSKEDFFAGYYTATDTVDVTIALERAKLPVDFKMELSDAQTQELTLQELYARCSKSVVAILGYKDGAEFSWGTGIILSSDGLIITNTHVIDSCDCAKVLLWNDDEYDALLVGADATSDIAVLQIEAKKLPVADYCTSDTLVVGDRVVAIGNPLGESFRATLTDGIISGIDRGVSYNGRTMTVLQTNTALNSGNSGGPLFNIYGQVVGVTNMKMMSSYSSIEGIGFAIPTKTVLQIVNGLVKDGEFRGRTSIGMTVGAIPDNAKEEYSLPSGLYVTDVTKGSGADKAGIRSGDIVIKVNGIEVTESNEVLAIKDEFAVGDMLPITVWRDGKIIELEVELMDTNDVYG